MFFFVTSCRHIRLIRFCFDWIVVLLIYIIGDIGVRWSCRIKKNPIFEEINGHGVPPSVILCPLERVIAKAVPETAKEKYPKESIR